ALVNQALVSSAGSPDHGDSIDPYSAHSTGQPAMTMNAQTMLELADDIADIPHEVNLTPRQARLLQEAANRLRETAAFPPSQEVPAESQRAVKPTAPGEILEL